MLNLFLTKHLFIFDLTTKKTTTLKTLLDKFLILGHHPNDSDDEKLRKTSLVIMSGPFAFAGLLWGVLYWANGLIVSGYIPFIYGLLSVASVIYFAKTTRYTFFRNSQLLLILILPFSLQISLGGYIPAKGGYVVCSFSYSGSGSIFNKRQPAKLL